MSISDVGQLIADQAREAQPLAKLLGTIELAQTRLHNTALGARYITALGEETTKIFAAYDEYRRERGF